MPVCLSPHRSKALAGSRVRGWPSGSSRVEILLYSDVP